MRSIANKIGVRAISALLLISLLSLTLAGCGTDREQAEGGNGSARTENGNESAWAEGGNESAWVVGELSYMAEVRDIPHGNISEIATHQNTLFYLSTEVSEDEKTQQTLYRMDLGTEQGEAAAIPVAL